MGWRYRVRFTARNFERTHELRFRGLHFQRRKAHRQWSDDQTLRVWDAKTHNHLLTLEGHKGPIWKVVALQDEQRVLSCSWDKTLRLWDITSGKCLKTIEGSDEDIFSVAVTRDGERAVSGHRGGKIRVWNLDTAAGLATLTGHSDNVFSIRITSDGRRAVSGSEDRTVKLWDTETGACVGTLEGYQNMVQSVTISLDGTMIASSGFLEKAVRLWDLKSGGCLEVSKLDGTPLSVSFSPDGLRLLVGTVQGEVFVYRLTGVRAAPPTEPTRRYVNAKVVLVGESTVGKTTLAHRLIEDRYVKTDSTHGMNVWPLVLPLEEDTTMEREALLWDLAGQEDYRLIHQLYLEETALALLLINPQRDDPFAEAGDWIKALRSADKLLIPTRLDVGGMKVSQRKIDRFLKDHGFLACLPPALRAERTARTRRTASSPRS